MELRDIEIFLTLAEELHFGRTAERLHVSQARVSQTIKQVERRIGAPLFARTSRRVQLTPIGRRLRDDLGPAYRALHEGIERAVTAGRGIGGVLRLGFEAPGVADLTESLLDRFRQRYPETELLIREADFADPFAMLRSGEIDVLVTLLPADEADLTTGPAVYREPMVLAVSSKHPFARRNSVSLDDLARDTVLRAAHPPEPYWVEGPRQWLTPAGHPVTRGKPFATFQELLAAIATGAGICPLAAHAREYFSHPRIRFVPFTGSPDVEWGLVWPRSAETARVQAFANVASSTRP
ncbi:LysR family transcriptional regulator [Amycolatopsis regifaucium]|uniref:LysR family transcriptional regulator n=1 Tax=Amycolatopsis regifaucium TaxID=546365 RepID=A0A154MST5_9PSEU|nr:LysR family transcriptional regulator [Amycolatopsis regifaucium]KZB86847.1 LysR family transcriptional regulator [Amycolatopsis regifaucium]OKA09278.1 LysR family transcriptional regulator [Amycolatopsis regifaucium]SFH57349.1 DNA-binding transcriptional regulator, LysR family [Amycolatopsis regifaucium]